ncbi:unnamed protein product [Phytophthora fragariaefolia]|uniref:Unnamed protein product n=1 Tax=Phytophthora fragariaefolia TaxID=1490495 RepID=A0A9W7CUY5_9STRA|nr:unnamed protein product [Phytophthora fragariaefolia]
MPLPFSKQVSPESPHLPFCIEGTTRAAPRAAMVSDELAPLQVHVEAQLKHLTAITSVVRELQSIEEQYAKAYASLAAELPADTNSTLQALPQLQRVTDGFRQFVRKSSVIKATVAEDLARHVVTSLEAFTAEHVEKSQHLLSELYELLQKEKAFDLAYQNLLETCEKDRTAERAQGDSTRSESVKVEVQLHREHTEQLLRKRDSERLTIQQWITALHFAGQRYEARVQNVLQQVVGVYDRMIAALMALAGEYQAQLGCDTNASNSAAILSGSNNSSSDPEENWVRLMAGCDCHVAITSWMSELFKMLIPAEQKSAKSMQKAIKLDRALCKAFRGAGMSAHFVAIIQFHDMLTMNISNPIVRTLKFSKERQERMRNELVKSLEETRHLVDGARARLNARLAKENSEEKSQDPVRCDSITSSEASECSLDSNNQEDTKECESSLQQEVLIESTPEQVNLDTLERKLALQRQEMTRVLEQTSYLSVKTMELVVQDHVKLVIKALDALKEAVHTEPPQTQLKKTDAASQPWKSITKRLAISVTDQPEVPREVNHNHTGGDTSIQSIQRLPTFPAREVNEPKTVQVVLSAAQTTAGVAAWAATMIFKTAQTHLPPSWKERVVLAAIVAMIVAMIDICVRSNQIQTSWSDLTDIQHANFDDIMQILKLSLKQCTHVNVVVP